jgi:hypothetical protein
VCHQPLHSQQRTDQEKTTIKSTPLKCLASNSSKKWREDSFFYGQELSLQASISSFLPMAVGTLYFIAIERIKGFLSNLHSALAHVHAHLVQVVSKDNHGLFTCLEVQCMAVWSKDLVSSCLRM